ncbi:MAG: aminopeptidase P family protein [Oscillospiraceae bacterium]|nr:aminopeptidase P family protein [Oscillospiraceae bacterium]
MNNFRKIMAAVAAAEIDALMLESPVNRQYASGFDASDGAAIITAEKAWFFTDSRYIEAAENTITDAEVLMVTREYPYSKRINDVIASENIRKLGFEEYSTSYHAYEQWREKLNAELVPAQKIVTDLRAVKTAEELSFLIDSQRTAEKSFNEILPLISTEITERELAAELLYRFQKNGAEDKSFDSIIVSGPHSSMPHGVPSDGKIGKGFLTIDFGVRKNGWCSDTTRTLCVGEPTDEMRKVYEIVLEAQLAGIAAAHEGATGSDIDGAARAVIEKAGYGEEFGHGFGHGVGLEVHEAPYASPSGVDPIPAGAVISAEPGIYLPGRFGVRIEDVIYITETGCVDITELPKELIIL